MLYSCAMPRLSLLPVLVRELFGQREFPREPEPALAIDADQASAYEYAGRIDGVMAASYLYHSAQISRVIQGCARVLDLGCGPATQLAQLAQLNPETFFIGVDCSPAMLDSGRAHLAASGLANVELRQADMARLDGLADASVDAVTSTMSLHHLPTRPHLDACFQEIARVLKPGGALYLADFGRLKSLQSVLYFAYLNAAHQPHLFSLDYERSLRAAFLFEDLAEAALHFLPTGVTVASTFQVPYLVVMTTAANPLPPAIASRLLALRDQLPRKFRSDLRELLLFCRLGGLGCDPFR